MGKSGEGKSVDDSKSIKLKELIGFKEPDCCQECADTVPDVEAYTYNYADEMCHCFKNNNKLVALIAFMQGSNTFADYCCKPPKYLTLSATGGNNTIIKNRIDLLDCTGIYELKNDTTPVSYQWQRVKESQNDEPRFIYMQKPIPDSTELIWTISDQDYNGNDKIKTIAIFLKQNSATRKIAPLTVEYFDRWVLFKDFLSEWYDAEEKGKTKPILIKQNLINTTLDVTKRMVNGKWGEWTRWSECDSTCGEGKRRTSRICNSPAPFYGGHLCQGINSKEETCEQDCESGNLTSLELLKEEAPDCAIIWWQEVTRVLQIWTATCGAQAIKTNHVIPGLLLYKLLRKLFSFL